MVKSFLKTIKICNAYSFETYLNLLIMLGKIQKPVVLLRKYYILLEGNIVLLYILDTVVNNQNIIFQGSTQTQNQKVTCILSRVERKGKTKNKGSNQRGNQGKQWNNTSQDDRQLYQGPCCIHGKRKL